MSGEALTLLIDLTAMTGIVWFSLQLADAQDWMRKAGPGAGEVTPRPGDSAHVMSLTHDGSATNP